jgi:DIS3-like exonuclease 2
MHRVAIARRKLRFDSGALALHGIKLTFQLDSDGQTPLMAVPYPIRDSNRLIEEYMLLANYLVAQRLISHAKGRALLRQHPEPLDDGLDKVVEVAKASINFDIDASSSQTLHASLHRLSRECDDPLVLQSITQMLMTPMQPADYFAAGQVEPELWRHFALNIPYYTHFTSPIRRYPDVIVHRLLQATIDGEDAVEDFPLNSSEIHQVCDHCNGMRMKSKTAQERCDRVFLSLYVRSKPMESQLGVVLSVGVTTFTVYVPSLGINVMLFLEEHKEGLTSEFTEQDDGGRRIVLKQKPGARGIQWGTLEIKVFTKIVVTVYCRDKPPIDVKLKLEGPWTS